MSVASARTPTGADRALLQRLADRHRQLADAFHFTFELVARHRRGDARGRAGHDDVAGLERDHLRELRDDLRHVPDHLRQVAVLANLAVALEADVALARMSGLQHGPERAARRGCVERLADLPRALDVARGDLQIAAREVDADAV